MENNIIIKTENLTKRYKDVTVVDQLNLAIPANEAFGLLGPNGAGKTTTILMLLGLTEPSSGSTRISGFDPVTEPLKVKRITGYMPEKVGFYDNLTPVENLDLTAQFNNLSREESRQRTDELLKAVGLDEAAHQPVGEYSRGMKQRLGIADILIKQPQIAIFDEPTAGLDPEGISQVLELIANLPKTGTTVIMSSHRLYEVEKVCHRIGILSKGKLLVEGKLEELSQRAKGESRYQIEVETGEPAGSLVDTIKGIKGVTKVTVRNNHLIISTETDLRAEISRIVVQNNVPLVEIKIQELTLDDIYLRYFHQGEQEP